MPNETKKAGSKFEKRMIIVDENYEIIRKDRLTDPKIVKMHDQDLGKSNRHGRKFELFG